MISKRTIIFLIFILIIIIVLLAIFLTIKWDNGPLKCRISLNLNLPINEPILLYSYDPIQNENEGKLGVAPTPSFLVPNANDEYIHLKGFEKIILACPGNDNFFKNIHGNPKQIEAKCLNDNILFIDNYDDKYDIHSLECNRSTSSIVKSTDIACDENGKIFEIGFLLENKKFVTSISGCFDMISKNVIWTNYTLVGGINGQRTGVPRPDWTDNSEFFSFPADPQYKRKKEQETIGKILGSEDLGLKYIENSGNLFLSRGHTTAKADFALGSLQRATFHLINAAPQWQTFNGGNWNALEMDLRKFVGQLRRDIKVWTGTYGILELPNFKGNLTKIYLYSDDNNNLALPVPRYFWKVAYDPMTEKGIVLFGLNNPYELNLNDIPPCVEEINKAPPKWLTWGNSNNIKLGRMYWCTLSSFKKIMPSFPNIPDKGILNN